MRFLLDQSSDARLIPHLLSLGHDAIRVGRDYPARLPDVEVLRIAAEEGRILITDDRDFGELVFRQRQAHVGVIYLRLGAYVPLETAIERLDHVLERYAEQLDQFLVVSPHRVRVRVREPEQ
jgi:predicted nuclease of predicted toxin-antitoxin system